MKAPNNFNGGKFREIYGQIHFWEDKNNNFFCPALPDLTISDLEACIVIPLEPAPVRDFAKEIDELILKVEKLEKPEK